MNLSLTITSNDPQEMATVITALAGVSAPAPAVPVTAAPVTDKPKGKKAAATEVLAENKETVIVSQPQAETSTDTGSTTENGEVTIEQVRKLVVEKTQANKRDEVIAILKDCGAAKVTDLQPAKYAYVLNKLNEL